MGKESRPHVGSISARGGVSNVNARQASPSGANVHCSIDSACLAPMARSKRSVVARSAAIPFSSCPIDLHPFAERGSFNISRSVFFWRHSSRDCRPCDIIFQSIMFLPWTDAGQTIPKRPTRRVAICPVEAIFTPFAPSARTFARRVTVRTGRPGDGHEQCRIRSIAALVLSFPATTIDSRRAIMGGAQRCDVNRHTTDGFAFSELNPLLRRSTTRRAVLGV